MTPSRTTASLVLVGWFVLVPPIAALASPGGTAPRCSDQAYRQTHLRECNLGGNPGIGVGAGGGSGGGIIGLIGGLLHGIGL